MRSCRGEMTATSFSEHISGYVEQHTTQSTNKHFLTVTYRKHYQCQQILQGEPSEKLQIDHRRLTVPTWCFRIGIFTNEGNLKQIVMIIVIMRHVLTLCHEMWASFSQWSVYPTENMLSAHSSMSAP